MHQQNNFIAPFPLHRVSRGPIKSLVGTRILGVPSAVPRMDQRCFPGAAGRAGEVAWAAICSSGEVAFLLLPADIATEDFAMTVVKRFFLASWLAGNTPTVMQITKPMVFHIRRLLVCS